MRICLVSREFATFTGGGIGTYAAEQAKAYQRFGHDVHVLTDAHEGLAERGPKVVPGVTFHGVDLSAGRAALDAYPAYPLRHAAAVGDAVQRLHAEHHFDYIEFADYWGEGYFTIGAKRASTRYDDTVLAVRLHTPTDFVRDRNLDMSIDGTIEALQHMESFCLEHADVLVSPCRSLLDYVHNRFPRRGGEHDTVIHYPFDPRSLEMGREADAAASPADTDERPRSGRTREIVYFGRLERRKGVIDLVTVADRMLARGMDVRFRLVGGDTKSGPFDTSMRAYLDRLITADHGDRLTFEQNKPRHELIDIISNADVCCFPSLWENFPNVCLEAMSLGAVVVGSRHGGMAEMIEHGVSGLLFPGGDAERLERTLLTALELDDDQRRAMGEAARERIGRICEPGLICNQMESLVANVRSSLDAGARGRTAAIAGLGSRPEGAPLAGQRPGEAPPPAVSVVVPYYNMGKFLPATLDSIRAQTFTDFETIIVDDGSTDPASLRLLESLVGSSVRVVRKRNGGLSSARNAGFAEARADWVLPLDADDVIDPEYIEKLLAAAALNPNATVVSSLVSYFVEDPEKATGGWVPFGLDAALLRYRNCAAVATGLIRRSAAIEVGGYDEWLTSFEDWDLYARLAEAGHEAVIVPEYLFRYRVRPDSMARTTLLDHRDQIRAYLAWKRCEGPEGDGTSSVALRRQIAECEDLRRANNWWQNESARLRARIVELEAYAGAMHTAVEAERAFRHSFEENVRYRIADRVNSALKNVGLQRPIKTVVKKTMRSGSDSAKP